MKSRITIFSIASLLLLALTVTACGGPPPPATDTADEVPLPQIVEVTRLVEVEVPVEVAPEDSGEQAAMPAQQSLTVSFPGDNRQAVMTQIIDSFIAKKAREGTIVDITINQPTEGYNDQVLLDFSAGVGPDVFSLSAESIPEFVTSDYLLPIDDRVSGWDEWGNFPSGMQQMTTYNGQTYGVMYDTDTRLLYYRTDVFEQAGLPVPWTPFTWEDVLGAAAQIRDTVPGVVPMEVQSGTVWGEATTVGGFLMLFQGAGGTLLDTTDNKWVVESPEMLETFRFYDRMFADGLSNADWFMEPEPWVPYLQEGFANGNVGIIVSGSWMWGLYDPTSEWAPVAERDTLIGWAPMPARAPGEAVNGQDYIGLGGGWGWMISKQSQNPDLAWEFVQFMTSADSVSRYTGVMGSIPSRSDAATDNEFYAALAQEVLPYQSFRPSHPDYNRVSAEIQIATERIMLDEATPEEAMAQFATAVEALVGQRMSSA